MKSPEWLTLRSVQMHNLRDVTLRVPHGRLTAVTGVSGSGKSTLVRAVLLPALRQALGLVQETPPGEHAGLDGVTGLRRAVEIDQSPIGRTPRSVPATYIGIWDAIRKLFAGRPRKRARAGYERHALLVQRAPAGRCRPATATGAHDARCRSCPTSSCPARPAAARASTRARWPCAGAAWTPGLLHGDRCSPRDPRVRGVPKVRRPLRAAGGPGASATCASGSPATPSAAARRSASSWSPSSPARQLARAPRSTCWTSPPPACTAMMYRA